MFSVGLLAGSGLSTLILSMLWHRSLKEKDEAMKKGANKQLEETVVKANRKPKATSPELRAFWNFFEAFEKGKVKVDQNCERIMFAYEGVNFYVYDSADKERKYVYIYHERRNLIDVSYHVKKKEFLELKDGMNLLDEENTEIFAAYFDRFVHSAVVSERQIEKADLANQSVRNLQKETPHAQPSAFSWEDMLHPLKKDYLHEVLLETTTLLGEVIAEKAYLDAEACHRLERVEKTILPDLVQSYLQLSGEERMLQQESMKASLIKTQTILNDFKRQTRKQYVTTFEKNVERLNQLEM